MNYCQSVCRCVGKKWLFWFCEGLACVSGKTKCAICGLAMNFKIFCAMGKKIKHRRVGNECRLTRCPFSIWSVCWSPVKMVCPCVNVHFLVVRVIGCCVVLHLPETLNFTTLNIIWLPKARPQGSSVIRVPP